MTRPAIIRAIRLVCLVILAGLMLPHAASAGESWIKIGGGASSLTMSDFNDGIAQMNDLMRDGYRLDILAANPGISAGELAAATDRASAGHELDKLERGITFSLALGRRVGDKLGVAVEIERMIDTKDFSAGPDVGMYYDAPLTMVKLVVESRMKDGERLGFGIGAAGGYGMTTGYMRMPRNNERTSMREAYLSGKGLIAEGWFAAYYKLSDDFAYFGNVGYRVARMGESDQDWFHERNLPDLPPEAIEIDDGIPLQLDFSGVFVKVGFVAGMPR